MGVCHPHRWLANNWCFLKIILTPTLWQELGWSPKRILAFSFSEMIRVWEDWFCEHCIIRRIIYWMSIVTTFTEGNFLVKIIRIFYQVIRTLYYLRGLYICPCNWFSHIFSWWLETTLVGSGSSPQSTLEHCKPKIISTLKGQAWHTQQICYLDVVISQLW